MPIEAWAFALGSASLFGLGLVITQFGLRDMTPALGATFSMPMAALVFWGSAPFLADFSGWDGDAVLLFAVVGIFFPGMITLLTFEANRMMGPYVSGAIGNLAPLFAVIAALVVLGEALDILQWLAVVAILGGVSAMSLRRQWDGGSWRRWVIALPLGAALCRGLGPVSLTSPVVACYPVFTMIFGAILLGRKKIDRNQGFGVLLTVVGVVLLTAS